MMVQQIRAQQTRIWHSGEGERRWLSMLVDAMENVSRPEFRTTPCDPKVFSALRRQLARPGVATPVLAGARRVPVQPVELNLDLRTRFRNGG